MSAKLTVILKIPKTKFYIFSRSVSLKPYYANFPPKPLIITVTGGNSRTGRYIGLILKQFPLIDEIRLFDYHENVKKVVADINFIDASTKVVPYCGARDLKPALEGSHVIAACPEEKKLAYKREDIHFDLHAEDIRNIAMHASEFNPNAIFCIVSQPVNALVPMVSEEYKRSRTYDYRKIIGVTAVDVMRANYLIGQKLKINPKSIYCPVIGGSSTSTTVAFLTYVKQLHDPEFTKDKFQALQDEIGSAETNIFLAKNNDNDTSPQLSRAYAAAQFIIQVCRGLKGICNCIECGFVKQVPPVSEYLSYMATVIKLGPKGIERVYMPKLGLWEGERLSLVVGNIRKDIEKGQNYVSGAQPIKKKVKIREDVPCNTVIAEPTSDLSKTDIDLTPISTPNQNLPIKNPRYLYQ